jgi:hypothetical protein
MLKLEDLSKQEILGLVRKGKNRCPVCGGTPSVRSQKGKFCEYHIELRTSTTRRNGGYGKHNSMSAYEKANWSLGAEALAEQFGVQVRAIHYAYNKLVRLQRIQPIKGFLDSKKPRIQSQKPVDEARISMLLPLLLRRQPHDRTQSVVR